MPRQSIDYNNTHFYKICCKDLNITDIYIGHTTDFRRRKNRHKSCCLTVDNPAYNFPVYQFIRENGGWDNFDMILLETKSCSDSLEAKKIEREFVEQLHATLNRWIPGRTREERYEIHKTEILENKKEYYQANKDTINDKRNIKIQCEICGATHSLRNKSTHLKTKSHLKAVESV